MRENFWIITFQVHAHIFTHNDLKFTQNGTKSQNHPEKCTSMGGNALLMREARLDWADRKAKVIQISNKPWIPHLLARATPNTKNNQVKFLSLILMNLRPLQSQIPASLTGHESDVIFCCWSALTSRFEMQVLRHFHHSCTGDVQSTSATLQYGILWSF